MWRAPAVVALLLAASPAGADYDRTRWGMSLAEVQALHPGGHAGDGEDGHPSYWVLVPVGGRRAIARFTFGNDGLSSNEGLSGVVLKFPRQGTPVDLATGAYTRMTKVESRELLRSLKTAYGVRLGKPFAEDAQGASWTAGKDFVGLATSCEGDLCTVRVVYTPLPTTLHTGG